LSDTKRTMGMSRFRIWVHEPFETAEAFEIACSPEEFRISRAPSFGIEQRYDFLHWLQEILLKIRTGIGIRGRHCFLRAPIAAFRGRFPGQTMHFSSWTCGFDPTEIRKINVGFPLMTIAILFYRRLQIEHNSEKDSWRLNLTRLQTASQEFDFFSGNLFSSSSSYFTDESQGWVGSLFADFALYSA
jgi:hypothetical protein